MNAPLRKGWCPGALRPMEAKDGLLVRLRITGGIVPAETAHALADLAERHGNGRFDLSSRGNLQMRGVSTATLPALHQDLRGLGLLDANAAAESVRNVIASPLAGLHDGPDIRTLVSALEARLVADAALHALPGKFGIVVDDGSRPTLADVDADVRFDWDGAAFVIGLGGNRDSATCIGRCDADAIVDETVSIAEAFLEAAAGEPDARRMRDVVASVVPRTSHHAQRCGSAFPCDERDQSPHIVGLNTFEVRGTQGNRMTCLGLSTPFGRLDAAMLRAAADIAAAATLGELRLTPFRTLLIPGAAEAGDVEGFITDPDDPRLAAAACVGAAGCARGTTDAQADAEDLAAVLVPRGGITLHVSGCEKGCAKSSATALTLVARGGRYDLVRSGRASDTPIRRGLNLAAARAVVRALA